MENLEKFMMCVKNIKPLREKFVSCKDLRESYKTFKIMLNGCSYEKYEKFFKNLINNSNEISDDELSNVAGGALRFGNILTPLAALTVFAGTAAGISYASEVNNPNKNNPSGNKIVVTNSSEDPSDDESEEIVPQGQNGTNNAEIKDKPDNTEEKLENKTEKQEFKEVEKTTDKEKVEVKNNEENDLEDKNDEGKSDENNIPENKENPSDTTKAEIEYSLKFIEKLPKKGEENFDKFLELPDKNELNENRTETIKEKGKDEKIVELNEKEVYDQIQKTVDEIIAKVKIRTPSKDLTEDQIITEINNRKISKHYKLPEELRIAKGIYRWVAKNISYDFNEFSTIKSIAKGEFGAESFLKPQDAIFVYNLKSGVCEGYARLTNLMMRMAKVHSAYVCAIDGKDEDLGHAFNTIYMDDKISKKGWTLIDSTWGSPNSDSFRQNESKDPYSKFMEGKISFYNDCFKYILSREDDYTKKLHEAFKDLNAKDLNEDDIKDLNKKAAEKLSELNKEYNSGPKYEKIEFCLEKVKLDNPDKKRLYEVMGLSLVELNVNYKTNLSKKEAKEIVEKEHDQSIIDLYIKVNRCMNFNNNNILLEELNRLRNTINMEKPNTLSYTDEVSSNVLKILDKYKEQGNKRKFDNLNKELKEVLNEINNKSEYDKLNKIKSIYLKSNEGTGYEYLNTLLCYETDLSLDEAKAIDAKAKAYADSVNCKIKTFFPGFYNEGPLETANRAILKKSFHKIKEIETNWFREGYDFEIKLSENESIKCKLSGHETKAYIKIDNISEEPTENFRIPKELKDLNIPFKIGFGIKSLILEGDEEVDLDIAFELDHIDVSNSNKYIIDDDEGLIYEKNKNGTKGKLIDICGKKFKLLLGEIRIKGDTENPEDLIIPEVIREFSQKNNKEIAIMEGIKSVTLQGDDKVNLYRANDLESIDVSKSNKYTTDSNDYVIALLEKDANGIKGELVHFIKKIDKIGVNKDVDYEFYYDDDTIHLTGNENEPAKNLVIPQGLIEISNRYNKKFNIESGIKSLVLQGDEEIDLNYANDLESIDATESTRYMVEDGNLYEKNKDGSKGKLIWLKSK